jgi:D-alanyl-D-alanine carboxypeptidase
MLVRETKARGYLFGTPDDPSYGCWGYSCRCISGSNTASNHSWGLALDINAPSNPYTSPLVTDMPSWMPDLWNLYGWRWGGDYSGDQDAMHYEFMESVQAAADLTAMARGNGLGGGTSGGGTPTPQPDDDEEETMKLLRSDTGAIFAHAPGRFFNVASPDHLDIGVRLGQWDGSIVQVSGYDLDVARDNAIGNGAGKCDNIPAGQNPSSM